MNDLPALWTWLRGLLVQPTPVVPSPSRSKDWLYNCGGTYASWLGGNWSVYVVPAWGRFGDERPWNAGRLTFQPAGARVYNVWWDFDDVHAAVAIAKDPRLVKAYLAAAIASGATPDGATADRIMGDEPTAREQAAMKVGKQ